MTTFAKSWISELSSPGGSCGRRAGIAVVLSLGSLLAASSAEALEPGEAPPAIDRPDQSGATVSLPELEGKVVLVNFWASWCGPCRHEMPVLQALHEKYASEGLVIVGINIDRNSKKMKNFLKGSPVTFRIVHDPKKKVAAAYEPSAMPTSYFIGRDGKLHYIHEGFREEDSVTIEAQLKSLLSP